MIVTDLKYSMEDKLVKRLDIIAKRVTRKTPKKDALIINEGGEGEGKTNTSLCEAYYLKQKTGKDIHLFFRLGELVNFAKNNKGKIIIWDEPGLDSLSTDHYKETNKNLIRLLMTCRKNRHIFIINMTKFWKFNEYIVVDRCLAMVHMYSRDQIIPGRFFYIRKKHLEALFLSYKSKKQRLYSKYKSFGGAFPNIMEDLWSKMGIIVMGVDGTRYPNSTLEDYEREKDKGIQSIGTEPKQTKTAIKLQKMMYNIALYAIEKQKTEEIAEALSMHYKNFYDWREKYQNV